MLGFKAMLLLQFILSLSAWSVSLCNVLLCPVMCLCLSSVRVFSWVGNIFDHGISWASSFLKLRLSYGRHHDQPLTRASTAKEPTAIQYSNFVPITSDIVVPGCSISLISIKTCLTFVYGSCDTNETQHAYEYTINIWKYADKLNLYNMYFL